MAADRLQFAEPFRPGLWRKVLEAGQLCTDLRAERPREDRMNVLHAAGFDPQHAFDHGILERRAFGQSAMQFDMLGAGHRHLHRVVAAIDRDVVEHDRGALRNGGQPDNARARRAPVHLHRRRARRVGNGRGRLEFGDQQFRIVDLRDRQYLAEIDRDRRGRSTCRLRGQLDARAVAADFEAERKAGDRLFCTVIASAGPGLLCTPGIGLHFGLRDGIKPERTPCRGGNQEQDRHHEERPARAVARSI